MRGAARRVGGALSDVATAFVRDDGFRHAAALSYYALFSVAPLLVVATGVVAFFFGPARARAELEVQLHRVVTPGMAETLLEVVENLSRDPDAGRLATGLGIAGTVVAATTLFVTLQGTLNAVWGVRRVPGRPVRELVGVLEKRALSFLMVIMSGGLLLASLSASTLLRGAASVAEGRFPVPAAAITWADNGVSFALMIVLVAALFRVLPDVEIGWRDVLPGAFVASVLLVTGRHLIALYLSTTSLRSTYGAAGSLVAFLVFVYLSAVFLILGAEITQVLAHRAGRPIQPSPYAERVTLHPRADADDP